MLDIRFIRENSELVRENIRKKFQDKKLPLVDEVLELDEKLRAAKTEANELRANRNALSKKIGMLMGQAKKDPSKLEEAEDVKAEVAREAARLAELEKLEPEYEAELTKRMMVIPQMIDPSVPIGPDDSCNVEVQRFGEATVPDFEIPYHTEIMESFNGVDLDAARRVSGNGFYYLRGDIARLHSAVLVYARDFMIDKGFVYYIPPYMIHGDVVQGVMSQTDMDAMMYKIEGEDLYLIGTSEHSMIGSFIDRIVPEKELPITYTSYSPCFRKEKGAHGIEERGVYRIHQFEKQEMIVVCKPEESMDWYEKMWRYSVELFRSLEIPVRQLECCSGDLADLKVKSCDIEAWSPRQQKYFEVCSCSNLGDAQARRLKIRVRGEDGKLISEFGEMRRTPIRFADIPQDFIHALLSAEDDNFANHYGVDVKSLMRAAAQLLKSGHIQTGGSTITMQVAKNYFLTNERSFSRKINEILLALQIERQLTKDEILELLSLIHI